MRCGKQAAFCGLFFRILENEVIGGPFKSWLLPKEIVAVIFRQFLSDFPGCSPANIRDRKTVELRPGGGGLLKQQIHTQLSHLLYGLDDGGAEIVEVPKLPDSVKTDHLHIFWNTYIT